MKKQILSAIWLLSCLFTFSQQDAIKYTYDEAGNRTNRNIIQLSKDSISQKSSEESFASEEVFKENLGEQEITIYPNPTRGLLLVEVSNVQVEQSGRIEVYSLGGEKVFWQEGVRGSTEVDLSGVKPGTYILKIYLGEQRSTWKVVKK